MPESASQVRSLHRRAIAGVQQVLDHALNNIDGLEKVVVTRAIQMLQPRIEQRILATSEDNLRAEVQQLHELIETILQEPSPVKLRKPRPKSRRRKVH